MEMQISEIGLALRIVGNSRHRRGKNTWRRQAQHGKTRQARERFCGKPTGVHKVFISPTWISQFSEPISFAGYYAAVDSAAASLWMNQNVAKDPIAYGGTHLVQR